MQTGKTTAIPAEYFSESTEKGEIVRATYATLDYSGSEEKITKPAYVYVPYGYDKNDTKTKYDILYLMHGWTGTAEDFFTVEGAALKRILDNMIEKGDIAPVIVVSPSFNPRNRSSDFSSSTKEIAVFHYELINELIPAIEGEYNTYADSTDAAGLKRSRAHRAFGGFSLGAVTTWYSFVYNLDAFKFYLPMSGDCWILGQYGGLNKPKETAAYLADVVKKSGYSARDFFIYSATGSNDAVFAQVDNQMEEMLRLQETFPKEAFLYRIKQGGVHNFTAVMEYIYGALPLFFPGTRQSE